MKKQELSCSERRTLSKAEILLLSDIVHVIEEYLLRRDESTYYRYVSLLGQIVDELESAECIDDVSCVVVHSYILNLQIRYAVNNFEGCSRALVLLDSYLWSDDFEYHDGC